MRARSLLGKTIQLSRARPSLWGPFITGWLRRGRNGFVPCAVPGGRKLLSVPLAHFYESYGFFFESATGRRERDYFLDRLKSSEVFYDIGGYRGAYSAIVKVKLQDHVAVHVFEPLPGNVEVIRQVRELNQFQDFKINPLAVGEGNRLVGHFNEAAFMLRAGDAKASDAETQVPSVALDEYVAQGAPVPTVMKIDVDGFEMDVLRGARGILEKNRPRLWLEVHPGFLKAQNKTHDQVLNLLREIGYQHTFFDDRQSSTWEGSYHVWCA